MIQEFQMLPDSSESKFITHAGFVIPHYIAGGGDTSEPHCCIVDSPRGSGVSDGFPKLVGRQFLVFPNPGL